MIATRDYVLTDQLHFERLNRGWIEKYFWMEPFDEWVLTKPEEALLATGGAILMAECDGVIAGTVALRKIDENTFEFTKMGVDPVFQRKGIAGHSAFQLLKKFARQEETTSSCFPKPTFLQQLNCTVNWALLKCHGCRHPLQTVKYKNGNLFGQAEELKM